MRSSPTGSGCSASTARRRRSTFEHIGYNSRLDEVQAAALRIFLRELDGWTAAPPRGRGALRRARARRAVRAAGRRAGARLPPRRLPLAGARPHPGRAHRGGDRERAVLPAAAPPPAGAPLPRLRGRLAARDRARRGGELLRAALGRDLAEQQERVVETVRAAVGVPSRAVRTPITRHRLPQLAADLAIILAAWFLAFRLRFDPDLPRYYEYYLELGGPRARRRAEARRRSRSSASTTAGGGTSRRATCGVRPAASRPPRSLTFLVFTLVRHPRGARAARRSGRSTGC